MPTYKGTRGLAQTFLRSGAQKGISLNETIRSIRAGGLKTYRRQDMLADYRNYAGIPAKANRIKNVRKDYRPGPDLFTRPLHTQAQSFRYEVKMEFIDSRSGLGHTEYTNVGSDQLLTRGETEDIARGYFRPASEEYSFEGLKPTLNAAFNLE